MPSAANDSRAGPASSNNFKDSKSNWLFGSGFPVLLGFMRVFRLREGTIFWRSLLQFSPKFSQNARRILKFNIWSITQVVVRGRTRNRFVLNRARGFESHHLRQKSQIQTNLRLFLLCASAATGEFSGRLAGFQGLFSPAFSPTGE